MKNTKKIPMIVTPDEALIIDGGFKSWLPNDDKSIAILEMLIEPLSKGKPVTLMFTEAQLWNLRDTIDCSHKSGASTGAELLVKIYSKIAEIRAHAPAWIDLSVKEDKITEEQEDASGSTSESTPNDSTESPT